MVTQSFWVEVDFSALGTLLLHGFFTSVDTILVLHAEFKNDITLPVLLNLVR